MGDSTRPTHKRHQAKTAFAVSLVAFLFASAAHATQPKNPSAPEAPAATLSEPPETTSIAAVGPGDEGIELSGRFTQSSMNYAKGIDWEVKNSLGEVLYRGADEVAAVKLAPGAYELLATYGNVHIDEALTLPPQAHINVNFVLNAGALRVLPRLKGLEQPVPPSYTRVFAVNGRDNGKLVASSRQPGEILKLAAGTYRVETEFEGGNVASSTTIEVKAGIIRSIDIDHHAGLLHLTWPGTAPAESWTVNDTETGGTTTLPATVSDLALKPGHYVLQADVGGKRLRKELNISEGETAALALGE